MLPAQIDRPPSRSAVASSAANHLAKAQGQIGKLLTYAPTDGLVPIELAAASPMSRLRSVARTGNLLIGFFVVGLGTWSALAPLTSAAVASGSSNRNPAAKPSNISKAASSGRSASRTEIPLPPARS